MATKRGDLAQAFVLWKRVADLEIEIFRSLPPSLATQYALDTQTLAWIEFEPDLENTRRFLHRKYPPIEEPTLADAYFVCEVVRSVVTRSTAYFAVAVHALATLRQELETKEGPQNDHLDHISIGCDGSVINKYPNYMVRAQESLNAMVFVTKGRRVILEKTEDSAVLGAAVAAALAAGGMASEMAAWNASVV